MIKDDCNKPDESLKVRGRTELVDHIVIFLEKRSPEQIEPKKLFGLRLLANNLLAILAYCVPLAVMFLTFFLLGFYAELLLFVIGPVIFSIFGFVLLSPLPRHNYLVVSGLLLLLGIVFTMQILFPYDSPLTSITAMVNLITWYSLLPLAIPIDSFLGIFLDGQHVLSTAIDDIFLESDGRLTLLSLMFPPLGIYLGLCLKMLKRRIRKKKEL